METPANSNVFRNNLIIAAGAVILGVAANYLFYDHQPGISFPLFILLAWIIFYSLYRYFGRSYPKFVYLTALIAFFSVMVGVRASPLLIFLNIALVVYLLLLVAQEATGKRFRHNLIKDYIISGIAPLLNFVVYSLRTLGDLLSLKGALHKRETTSDVIRGVVMALPVILVFLLLFASADLVFNKFLTDLVHLDLPEEFIGQMVFMGFVILGSLGALAYVFMNRQTGESSAADSDKPVTRLSVVQVSVFLGVIDALFLLFITFQLRYLFGGQANIIEQGFTYADYAHKGFIELIMVALISLVLILTAERYVNRRESSHMASFKTTALILIIGVIVIMASAFKRLHIYQDAYGFTILRFYVSAFIIWLSALFLAFGYKILKSKRDQFFAYAIFVGVIAFVGVMNVVNPEGIIVRQNITHYEKTGKLDTYYFQQLSEDAVSAMMPLLRASDSQVRAQVAARLYYRKQQWGLKENAWQETSLSRLRAKNLLDREAGILEQHKDFFINNDSIIWNNNVPY